MTYKLLILSALSSVYFSGCAQTAPEINGQNNVSGTDVISGETVNINENSYGNENSNGMNSKSQYNSSQDGFKSIYFAFGDYAINADMQENMSTNAQVASNTSARIKIEGNCDEFGTDEYNYALGLKRAKMVKDTLISQGVASSKMIMVSFGESSPVCSTPSDSCYDRNRRVDLRLVR
jgi:peptidoglycan-associated lipoprotein